MIREGRLSPELRSALVEAGWSAGRKVDLAGLRAEMDSYGYRMSGAAASLLESLHGLRIEGYVGEADPLVVDPTEVGLEGGRDTERLESRFGGHWFPIGTWLYNGDVYIEDGGRMVFTFNLQCWNLGDTAEEALELAICLDRPLMPAPGD
ncbi:SUKH-3 domain-containing protein [Glycomyces sp. NPDC046736]|uniref:SUKH-3 domain-containing protein n=1 Tax=Glycomyces sp. NPDC046736 TaxID=3155615 RepID=UPI003403F47F